MTPSTETDKVFFYSNSAHHGLVTLIRNARPAVILDSDVVITSGDGTNSSPYMLALNKSATPVFPGTYYVKATTEASSGYTAGVSSCVLHTIAKSNTTTTLENQVKPYTGSSIVVDSATSTLTSDSSLITNGTITYTYYDGNSCEGSALSGAPTSLGSYSMIATLEGNSNYNSSSSSCATLSVEDISYTISFDSQGGSSVGDKYVVVGTSLGDLKPYPTQAGLYFAGWYTESSGGTRVTSATIPDDDKTYYAQWISDPEAEIDGIYYDTLMNALNDVPTNNVQTAVTVLKNIARNENNWYTINAYQNVLLNIGDNHTISNAGNRVIEVSALGRLTIDSGTISCTYGQGAINVLGTVIINGGTISATGSRQALYVDGGNLTIYDGTISSTTSARATIHNKSNGTVTILGGSITSSGGYAIYNEKGTLTIGEKDGAHSVLTPIIQGKTYGIIAYSTYTYNFYDGIIKGRTNSIGIVTTNGNTPGVEADTDRTKIADTEDNSTYVTGTDGSYKTLYYTIQ
jgi:uncharacterized repeat protein (TIGR02543 family)